MPRAALRPCLRPGCPELVSGGYCDRHPAPSRAPLAPDTRPSAARRGYGSGWRALRDQMLAREPLCRACRPRFVPATEVDHIVPLAEGGSNTVDNLQPLCKSCHSRKTARAARGRGLRPAPEVRGLVSTKGRGRL